MHSNSLHNRIFISKSNTPNGEAGAGTRFWYRQEGDQVWASYHGGGILYGVLLGKRKASDRLFIRYRHLNEAGEWRWGHCHTRIESLPDGQVRLHESWQWDCGDCSAGTSVLESV